MERRTRRIILTIIWIIYVPKNLVYSEGVSSLIGFNLQEDEPNFDSPGTKVLLNLNEVDGKSDETSPIIFRLNDDSKMKSDSVKDDSTKESNACGDNVQIILNGNETKPGVVTCTNAICDISVSSHRDEEGNIVTDVHLKVTKKLEVNPKINDIPIIDGVRGIEDTYKQFPNFHRVNFFRPMYFHNDIPQIQTRYRDGEPWHQGRRIFQSPQNIWRYHRPEESAGNAFADHGAWPSRKPVVDDKIAPPFSKTRSSRQ